MDVFFCVNIFVNRMLDPDWLDFVVLETDFLGVVGYVSMNLYCL